ncbi:capsular polysaccharide biosynthesis protein Cap8M [Weissella viridescens]|uniref:sugar transferase n=1 Tax=Weissella viridescens TaxID=1629 RepID=UPI0011448BDC|nr:sugar transferase [Weissella viridescens]GEA94670.1 capsular polysaccharide biosynthesis protein Cap8M [Weissella viridescens]
MLYRNYFKRLIDMLVAALVLIIGCIPMLIVAIIVKITSPGPVFFKQRRYGLNSEPFNMYKFRSMSERAPELANQNFAYMDAYITPVGSFLRKTSIDELPQLINVFLGKMSLIGPRPLADTDRKVLDLRREFGADQVRPGITSLAQVNGRNNISDVEKAEYDTEYAQHVTARNDFAIVVQTIVKVVKQADINHE